jgi:hypothetical protein
MRPSKIQTAILLTVTCVPLLLFGWSWLTAGGTCQFSPDTLQIRTRQERIWLGNSFCSSPTTQTNPLIEYLVANGLVSPRTTANPRWLLLDRTEARQSGPAQGALYHPILRNHQETIRWCEEYPEVAGVYWTTGFALLRSDQPHDRQVGQFFLKHAVYLKSKSAMQQILDINQSGHQLIEPAAVQAERTK